MRKDPIVEEMRRAGDRLAAKYGYDIHAICEHLRETGRAWIQSNPASNGGWLTEKTKGTSTIRSRK